MQSRMLANFHEHKLASRSIKVDVLVYKLFCRHYCSIRLDLKLVMNAPASKVVSFCGCIALN